MAQITKIEWTEQSWNFLRGCRRVSEGCGSDRGGGCYAEAQAIRFANLGGPYEGLVKSTPKGPRWTGKISFVEDILLAPLKRKKPTTYFVNSMSDLFYEKVTDEMLERAFAVMADTPQHTYQILTKRPEIAFEFLRDDRHDPRVNIAAWRKGNHRAYVHTTGQYQRVWPLPNVWLGVSVEDQKTADERIPILLKTPAATRWISAEPLLGPIDLSQHLGVAANHDDLRGLLNWVVIGGESGHKARPFDIAWARAIIEQCKVAEVPVFIKQLGKQPVQPFYYADCGKARLNLKSKKGNDMSEWPDDLRIRQMPEVCR